MEKKYNRERFQRETLKHFLEEQNSEGLLNYTEKLKIHQVKNGSNFFYISRQVNVI